MVKKITQFSQLSSTPLVNSAEDMDLSKARSARTSLPVQQLQDRPLFQRVRECSDSLDPHPYHIAGFEKLFSRRTYSGRSTRKD